MFTLRIDKTGRILLPRSVRDELQVGPGDSLELECSEERIVLRPARSNVRMRKKQGIWVLCGIIETRREWAIRDPYRAAARQMPPNPHTYEFHLVTSFSLRQQVWNYR